MKLLATTLNSGVSFNFLAGVGSIGWLLTVYCIWDKFDSKKDKVIHLLSDIVNATFAVITVVAAVSIAVNFSIRLPDIISNRLAGDIRRAAGSKTAEVPPPAAVTLGDEIARLSRSGKLNNASLSEVLRRQFKGISFTDGVLYLRIDNQRLEITKNFEGLVRP